MQSDTFEFLAATYLVIAAVSVFGLTIRWMVSLDREKPIWPIAGIAWPVLVLIGLWKSWENRND